MPRSCLLRRPSLPISARTALVTTATIATLSAFLATTPAAGAAPAGPGLDGWSAPQAVDTAVHPDAAQVSCATKDFCAAVGGTRAATFDGSRWSPSTSVDPGRQLVGVSCATATFCMAVDAAGGVVGFDGTSWSAPTQVDPGAGNVEVPPSIQCHSSTQCIVSDSRGLVVSYDGSTWSGQVPLPGSPVLESASCGGEDFCIAVSVAGYAYAFDGTSWSTGDHIVPDNGYLLSVDCVSQTFCMATGSLSNGNDSDVAAIQYGPAGWGQPVDLGGDPYNASGKSVSCPTASSCMIAWFRNSVFRFNGASWRQSPRLALGVNTATCGSPTFCIGLDTYRADPTVGMSVVLSGSTWSQPRPVFQNGHLDSVSCPTPSFCAAVDSAGRVVDFDGTRWTGPLAVDPTSLSGVSCASAQLCIAVDDAGQAVEYDGTDWSAPVSVAPGWEFLAVSCPSSTFCMAITADGAYLFDGTSWSGPTDPDSGEGRLEDVSCPSSGYCVAVDSFASRVDRSFVYSDRSWSGPTTITASRSLTRVRVSCPRPADCLAILSWPPDGLNDTAIYSVGFDGTSWGGRHRPISRTGMPGELSCATTTSCVLAVAHRARVWDGTAWSSAQPIDPHGYLAAVACGATGFCVAADGRGDVVSTTLG